MPRHRRGTTNTEAPTNDETQGENKMATTTGLTPEQISALLGKTRQRGQYIEPLNDFYNSDEAGVCVNDRWPQFAEKKAMTLKQGFESAKEKKEFVGDPKDVRVIVNDDKVFLINLPKAGVPVESGTDES